MFKRIFPIVIAIIIPIIILTSFIFMLKRRTFIFKEEFLKKSNEITKEISNDFKEAIKKDLLYKVNSVETFFREKENELKEEDIKIFIKNQVFDSVILDNIIIADNELNIKYSLGQTDNEIIKWLKWVLSSNTDFIKNDIIKIFLYKNKIILYKKTNEKMLFLLGDIDLFYKRIQTKYEFFKKGSLTLSNAVIININSQIFDNYNNIITPILPQLLSSQKSYQIELDGSYLPYSNILIKNNEEIILNIVLLVYCDPKDFPLTILHKFILLITGALLILISIISAIKIKYEIDKFRIENYETEDYLNEKMLSVAEEEEEEFKKPINKEEEELYEIPDEYFTKNKTEKPKDKELINIIEEVEEQEETAKKYESLWKNINSILEKVSNYSMAIFLKDEIGVFSPHFSKNTNVPLEIKEENWIFKHYTSKGKSLFISNNAGTVTPVKEIFLNEIVENLKSFLIAPLIEKLEENRVISGVLILFGENIEESTIREINDLINLG